MPELRWALLLLGLLFLGGLVLWESRKRRARESQRPTVAVTPSTDRDDAMGPGTRTGDAGATSAGAAVREEPAFSMPDLPRREPVRDLPIVEIDPSAADGPSVGELPVISMGTSGPAPAVGPGGLDDGDEDVSAARPAAPATADAVERAAAWLADSVPDELPQSVVVDWPPEDQRRIVALRVVPRTGERFNGSALRQALVGEGFVHGELDIYHKPVGDGRALLSAASLTRPGTFDPKTIDNLLFAGVNLFAVLPGPLPPRETLERLVLVGKTLAQRLRGEALDGRGQPLTDARVAELRREVSEGVA